MKAKIRDRLIASLKYDVINGDSFERSVLATQIKEAVDALAEKDALIKSLTERVHKYMAKYPNGANGCVCLFDDDDKPIQSCAYHNSLDAEIESLSKTISGFYDDCKKYHDECKRLENKLEEKDAEIESLSRIIGSYHDDCKKLKDQLEAKKWEVQALDRETKRLRDAIQGALRIDVLWVPKVADEEHWEEARALHLMRQSFIEALKEGA